MMAPSFCKKDSIIIKLPIVLNTVHHEFTHYQNIVNIGSLSYLTFCLLLFLVCIYSLVTWETQQEFKVVLIRIGVNLLLV